MMEWLRRWARRLLRDEIGTVLAELAVARADALDALLARERLQRKFSDWAGMQRQAEGCTKIRLHSQQEGERWIASVQERTASDDEYEVYPCAMGCQHPVVDQILHIRHVDKAGRNGARNRANARRGRPMSHRSSDDRLAEIRANLERAGAMLGPDVADEARSVGQDRSNGGSDGGDEGSAEGRRHVDIHEVDREDGRHRAGGDHGGPVPSGSGR